MTEEPPIDGDARRARLQTALAALEEDSHCSRDSRAVVTLDQTSVGRLARMDAMERQAMAAAAERRQKAEAARLREALKRLDADEFGWCADCGGRIPALRLAIDPSARRARADRRRTGRPGPKCTAHRRKQDRRKEID